MDGFTQVVVWCGVVSFPVSYLIMLMLDIEGNQYQNDRRLINSSFFIEFVCCSILSYPILSD